MSLRDQGFLSPRLADWAASNRANHAEWFSLADKLRRLSQDKLLAIPQPDEPNRLTMLLILARAVTTFQASMLLVERGLPADARTLARSFLETTMHYGAATKDPDFYNKLIAADRRHKKNIAEPLLRMGAEKTGLEPGQIDALEAWLADPEAPKPGSLPVEQLMNGMELGDIYNTYFRSLSGDAAHTTVESLNRHVAVGATGEMEGTKWGPDDSATADTLMALCSMMFYLMRWVTDTLGPGAEQELEACWTEYNRLAAAAVEAATSRRQANPQ